VGLNMPSHLMFIVPALAVGAYRLEVRIGRISSNSFIASRRPPFYLVHGQRGDQTGDQSLAALLVKG
jgi:hypothetical protein